MIRVGILLCFPSRFSLLVGFRFLSDAGDDGRRILSDGIKFFPTARVCVFYGRATMIKVYAYDELCRSNWFKCGCPWRSGSPRKHHAIGVGSNPRFYERLTNDR